MTHRSLQELESGVGEVRAAPASDGTLELIVARPAEEERELLAEGRLDLREGLVGDMWVSRPSSSRGDGKPNPEAQVTVMSARSAELVAGGPTTSAGRRRATSSTSTSTSARPTCRPEAGSRSVTRCSR